MLSKKIFGSINDVVLGHSFETTPNWAGPYPFEKDMVPWMPTTDFVAYALVHGRFKHWGTLQPATKWDDYASG